MRAQLSPFFCCSTKQRTWQLASVQRRVGLSRLKKERVGAEVRDCLAAVNAWSMSGDHMNSFFVLSSGCMSAKRWASVSVLTESWLARLTNEWRLVRLVGVGKLEIASVMDLSMEYPCAAAKVTCDWANSHFCSALRCRNCRTWLACWGVSLS